jgi:hypothetical protein
MTTEVIEQPKYKTLHVSLETHAELVKLGTFGSSFEDVIQMLLRSHREPQHLKNRRGAD